MEVSMNSMTIPEQVTMLFSDLSAFGRLAEGMKMEDYQPRFFDFFNYPLGVTWLGVPRNQTSGWQEAFVALAFFKFGYDNDLIYDESARTDASQLVTDLEPKDLWKRLLEAGGILDASHRHLNVTSVELSEFFKSFFWWKPNNIPEEEWCVMEGVASAAQWVYSLYPDDFYDLYFGQTEEYYFFAESGVYD